ncbi:MAG TPA: hypothetical protein VFS64_00140 [Solirubrobacterales bacterium]|nr:hypothetical protein [Solirubrobacterales bacterium]
MSDHTDISITKMEPKPVAGKDTPAADDIITPCAGRCGRWMVTQHPSHVRGGRAMDPETGEMRDWSPTPEWVEAEAERLAGGGGSCLSCGPVEISGEERAEREADRERVNALRDYSDSAGKDQ